VDSQSRAFESTAKERLGLMNPYTQVGSRLGNIESPSLSQRMAARHDAVVGHERRLRAGRTDDGCDEDCAHNDARAIGAEAVTTFGDRARELSVLRSRAMSPGGLRMSRDRPADTRAWTLTITDRAGGAARPTVSGRHQTSFLRISGGRTAEAKRGVEM
jgi:hypothetical protein